LPTVAEGGCHVVSVTDCYGRILGFLGREITDTIKKNMETLIAAAKEVGLEVNIEQTKYMLLSCHQDAG
jgi:hypothetical protein